MDWAKTTPKQDKNHLNFGIWCILFERLYGMYVLKKKKLMEV